MEYIIALMSILLVICLLVCAWGILRLRELKQQVEQLTEAWSSAQTRNAQRGADIKALEQRIEQLAQTLNAVGTKRSDVADRIQQLLASRTWASQPPRGRPTGTEYTERDNIAVGVKKV